MDYYIIMDFKNNDLRVTLVIEVRTLYLTASNISRITTDIPKVIFIEIILFTYVIISSKLMSNSIFL